MTAMMMTRRWSGSMTMRRARNKDGYGAWSGDERQVFCCAIDSLE